MAEAAAGCLRPKVLTLEIQHATEQGTGVHRGQLFDRSSVLSDHGGYTGRIRTARGGNDGTEIQGGPRR